MALDIEQLGADIGAAMLTVLQGHGRVAESYARAEADKFARTGELIAEGLANGDILPEQAKILLSMQEGASRAVLTAVATIGAIAAQDAINAGLRILVAAIETAAGIAIL